MDYWEPLDGLYGIHQLGCWIFCCGSIESIFEYVWVLLLNFSVGTLGIRKNGDVLEYDCCSELFMPVLLTRQPEDLSTKRNRLKRSEGILRNTPNPWPAAARTKRHKKN